MTKQKKNEITWQRVSNIRNVDNFPWDVSMTIRLESSKCEHCATRKVIIFNVQFFYEIRMDMNSISI